MSERILLRSGQLRLHCYFVDLIKMRLGVYSCRWTIKPHIPSNHYVNLQKRSKTKRIQDHGQRNAHRDAILGPNYNQVQIGVAYDPENGIYLVHEFETVYVNWTGTPPLSSKPGQTIAMEGNFTSSKLTIDSISVYYDPLPTPEMPSQLMNSPYDDGYGPGTLVGSVTRLGFIATNGVTIVAKTWKQTGTSFVISFTLEKAYKVKGDGIYTLYLFVSDGKSEPFPITNASLKVTQ